MEMESDHYKKVNRQVRSQKKVKKIIQSDVRKKWEKMSDIKKMENDGSDVQSTDALVRPLWRAAARGWSPSACRVPSCTSCFAKEPLIIGLFCGK